MILFILEQHKGKNDGMREGGREGEKRKEGSEGVM